MDRACYRKQFANWMLISAALSGALSGSAFAASGLLNDLSPLYVNRYNEVVQVASYQLKGADRDVALTIAGHPIAAWFTKGTPKEVQVSVAKLIADAAAEKKIPMLVAYNVPFRDCAQYSAGGAANTAAYKAWIDGFAAGIGHGRAIVILEPDGLGIIPHHTDINGTKEWCQPTELDPAIAANDRYEQLNYAVDKLKALANTSVYLDGTHSGWLGVGDAASRLVRAGVQRADGFFVNVSNYELTSHLEKYGTWLAKCIHYGTNTAEGGWRVGHFEWCASQYYPATPSDFSTWTLTDEWYLDNVDTAANPPTTQSLKHFVIDTSRNGQGPWSPPVGAYSDPQIWCNPPGRGLGDRPTIKTGNDLLDAKLWIKVPGESDGQCTRGTSGPIDPARGVSDPPAGGWFKEQAAELVALAQPALTPTACRVDFDVHASWSGAFVAEASIKNISATPIRDWNVSWAFPGDEHIVVDWGVDLDQSRGVVTANPPFWDRTLLPGRRQSFGFIGKQKGESYQPLLLFLSNETACSVR
jgi:endoglucanase